MENFAESTTIHGCKEIFRAPSKPVMVFWALVLFGCFVGLGFEIFYVFESFRETPYALNTQIKKLENLPPIIFATSHWANKSRLKEFDVDEEILKYLQNFYVSFDQSEKLLENSTKIRQKFYELVKKFNFTNLDEVFLSFALQPEFLIKCPFSNCKLNSIPFGTAVTYRIEFPLNSVRFSAAFATLTKFVYFRSIHGIELKSKIDEKNEETIDENNFIGLLIGSSDAGEISGNHGWLEIPLNSKNKIEIIPSFIKQLNTRENPCDVENENEKSEGKLSCEWDCLRQQSRKNFGCEMYLR